MIRNVEKSWFSDPKTHVCKEIFLFRAFNENFSNRNLLLNEQIIKSISKLKNEDYDAMRKQFGCLCREQCFGPGGSKKNSCARGNCSDCLCREVQFGKGG